MTERIGAVRLKFKVAATPDHPKADAKKFRDSLSAMALADDGRTLFLGGDETVEAQPSLERLALESDGGFGGHESRAVSDFITLPDDKPKKGRIPEIDIEGLAIDDGFLWLVGSHSAKREKPKTGEDGVARLAEVEMEENRTVLGRIRLVEEGGQTRFAEAASPDDVVASWLHGGKKDESLLAALRRDRHLGPFLQRFKRKYLGEEEPFVAPAVPGKDNGFDVEGLAVVDGRIFLGLRGPVLRGWAVVLELAVEAKKGHPKRLRLLPIGPKTGGKRQLYRKHFLDLGGLGIRDLQNGDESLLILAGPTMGLDGPVAVFRWSGLPVPEDENHTLTELSKPPTAGALVKVLDLPYGDGCDHAEANALLPDEPGAKRRLLVVYDSPCEGERRMPPESETDIYADIFELSDSPPPPGRVDAQQNMQ